MLAKHTTASGLTHSPT